VLFNCFLGFLSFFSLVASWGLFKGFLAPAGKVARFFTDFWFFDEELRVRAFWDFWFFLGLGDSSPLSLVCS
jgi:hypothetical protein